MKSQPVLLAYFAARKIQQKSFSLSEIVNPALIQYDNFVGKINKFYNVLTLLVLVVLLSPLAFNISLDLALSITLVFQFAVQISRLCFKSKLIKSIILKQTTQKVYKTL